MRIDVNYAFGGDPIVNVKYRDFESQKVRRFGDNLVNFLSRVIPTNEVLAKEHNVGMIKSLSEEPIIDDNVKSHTLVKENSDALARAVDNLLRDALDRVDVHPCDENNDEVKFNGLSDEFKSLYKARHNKQ